MISVCLVRPVFSGNIGSVARIMKNFDVKKLYLVNPKCNPFDNEAKRFSKHGIDILNSVEIKKDFSFLSEFNYIIGTTAIRSSDYNINRSALFLQEFLQKISEDIFNSNILLMFGSESDGLSNKELKNCDYVISIESSSIYPTLNLSHSVGVVLYSFFLKNKNIRNKVELANNSEKNLLIEELKALNISEKDKVHNQTIEKLIKKSLLTKREIFSLIGFFKKAKQYIDKEQK